MDVDGVLDDAGSSCGGRRLDAIPYRASAASFMATTGSTLIPWPPPGNL
ncbi:hypothetical protein ACFY4C_40430 [Actinomadura viridis]